MKNIKFKNILYSALLFFAVGCGEERSCNIETCIVNHADSSASHIDILFSDRKYTIPSLLPDEKKCFVTPLYSETSYGISLCMGNDKHQIKSMGYYWSESNISRVNIFLKNKTAIKSEGNNEFSNEEYRYINIGRCR